MTETRSRKTGIGSLNRNMLSASRLNNILIFSSPVMANFFNDGNKGILLGNISINSEYLHRDLMWIMNRKGRSAQHPGIRFLSSP